MPRDDRRTLKTQAAIKSALIAVMSTKPFDHITIQDLSDKANVGRRTVYLHYRDKYDLLDQLVKEHIDELRRICESASDLSFAEGSLVWFDYFKRNEAFFAAMLQSNEAASFRIRFFDYVVERLKHYVDVTSGVNGGLSEDVILHFIGTAIVGIVEAWFTRKLSEPLHVVAGQVGKLLDRNL